MFAAALCQITFVSGATADNLPKEFKHLPKGMFSMCSPAGHYDGIFFTNCPSSYDAR